MKKWKYYSPEFECDQYNYEMLRFSPWAGHRSFAYDLMVWKEPQVVVELGSYYGCSAFAFAQAIKDHQLPASLYCIDTWQGDSFTKQDYQEDIFLSFQEIRDKLFSLNRVEMLRCRFDEAAEKFPEESIDILHIDGSHLYEDVKHDYETWLPKVKKQGMILFHDVGEDLIENGNLMGSHIFWKELCESKKLTVTLDHSCGLGILFLSDQVYNDFIQQADTSFYQKQNNLLDTINKDYLRKYFFKNKDLEYYNKSLLDQLEIMKEHIEHYEQDTASLKAYVKQLEESRRDGEIKSLEAQLGEMKEALEAYKATVAGKDDYILQLESRQRNKDEMLKEYEKMVAGKDTYIEQLQKSLQDRDKAIEDYKEMVRKKDFYLQELEERQESLEQTIKNYEKMVNGKDAYIRQLEEQERRKDEALKNYGEMVAGKDGYIRQLEEQEGRKDEALKNYGEMVAGKDAYIEELEIKLGIKKRV